MAVVARERYKYFESFLQKYNECWFNRDINALKKMHSGDGDIVYYDNHSGCDSPDLEDHLEKVAQFLSTGTIVDLLYENMTVYETKDSACITAIVRYSNNPAPGVRATYFLEKEGEEFLIRHIHYSVDPNEENI